MKNQLESLPKEDIYGHVKRLEWIEDKLGLDDRIVEFGCGTGYMVTIPLIEAGYDTIGVDLHQDSIDYGKRLLEKKDLDSSRLKAEDFSNLEGSFDAIIASEVLEHLETNEISDVLSLFKEKLKPGGELFVTVPNGYGWSEWERFFWFDLGIGKFLNKTKIERAIMVTKELFLGESMVPDHPSTLSSSGHVQFFSLDEIKEILREHSFEIVNSTGSVFLAGPFANLILNGFKPVMELNKKLGSTFPHLSCGFYLHTKDQRQ